MSSIFTQAPGIVSIARTDATSITVTFTNASDPSVNSYTIVLNNGAPAVNNAVSPQLISGLNPDTTYTVNVFGSNGVNTAANVNNSIYLPPLAPNTDTALNFSGTGQYASVADSPRVDFADQFTAEAWINPASGCATTTCVIFNKGNSVTLELVNNQIEYEIDGNGNAPSLPTWRFVATGVSVVDGQWQHIALQKSITNSSATGVQIGLNGQTVFSGAAYNCTSGCTSSVSNTTRSFTIGGLQDTTTAESGKFLGAIDEFRLRTSALPDYAQLFDMDNYLDGFSGEVLHYDFNEGIGATGYNRNPTANGASDLTIVGSPTWVTTNTQTTVNKVTTATFRRPYLTSYGGWHVPVGVSAINELIVAGGGAGGFGDAAFDWAGGGGGAGGFVNDTATVTPNSFAALYVGMGEFPSIAACQNLAGGGQDSLFNSGTMSGGGQGGCEVDVSHIFNPTSGGSGGGGQAQTSNGNNTSVGAAPNDLAHFGHAGGNGHAANTSVYGAYNQASGGGGGAGSAGGNGVGGNVTSVATETSGNGGNAGDGGAGLSSTISGSTVWYGGGGGGTVRVVQGTAGSGGTGGGGNASIRAIAANDGVAGTGGGGGAASAGPDYAGAGGSGIIILKWLQPLLPIIITVDSESISYPTSIAASQNFSTSGNINSGETFTATYSYQQYGHSVSYSSLAPGNYSVSACITGSSFGIAVNCQLDDYSSITYVAGVLNYLKESRSNFMIGQHSTTAPTSADGGVLTGILGETNTLYVTGLYPGPDTSIATVNYSLVSEGSNSFCSWLWDSGGAHISLPVNAGDGSSCVVNASVAENAYYLSASDTRTIYFQALAPIQAIQSYVGNNAILIVNGSIPLTVIYASTASDSSSTTVAPAISGFTVSGSESGTAITIVASGSAFWAPVANISARLYLTFTNFPLVYLSVNISSNPQTVTMVIPSTWFTDRNIAIGTDLGPVVVRTPSGVALSPNNFVTQ